MNNHPYSDANVFMVYGFEKNGLTDPQMIAQKAAENGTVMKCPVLAANIEMAATLFSQKYPDLMIGGVVNLAELTKEVSYLREFLDEQIRLWDEQQNA